MPPLFRDLFKSKNENPKHESTSVSQNLAAKIEEARALQQQGYISAAQTICLDVLSKQPDHFDSLNLLGVLAAQSKDLKRAVEYFDMAISIRPQEGAPHSNRGLALRELGQLDAALTSLDRATALNDKDIVAYYVRGGIYNDMGRFDLALQDFNRVIAVNDGFAQAHFSRGLILQNEQRLTEALGSFDRAINAKADYAEAHANRGFVLYLLGRYGDAITSYDHAIAMGAVHAPVHLHRGNALKSLNQLQAALECYDKAIATQPDYAEALSNRGVVLLGLDRIDAALDSYARAIAIRPDYAEAYVNRAAVLRLIRHYEDAIADYRVAAALAPEIKFLPGAEFEAQMQICDWRDFDSNVAKMTAAVGAGEPRCHPFAFLTISDCPKLQRQAAETWVRETCPANDVLGPIAKRVPQDRIRVGYFSNDFREHPTSRLIAELIETHDRRRFEVIAFSFGPNTRDEPRKRLERAFDRFLDVRELSNSDIASLARSLNVDIAVDLCGYIHGSRPQIFSLRAAPTQVNYLGYPGTMGAEYIDYIVADDIVMPAGMEDHFVEKIIYLPGSYQVNDTQRSIANRVLERAELGLPPESFVFCCFNNNYKIVPSTFECWFRILKRVPASVLWLLQDNPTAADKLRQNAVTAGLPAERLIFAKRASLPEHLSRHRQADLFLDTLPYNAHTTASDALWAGLPVLTLTGEAFAARVAASLLAAVGLPELIASTRQEYEDLAVELGSNPRRVAEIKGKLARNRLKVPLFDPRLFARRIETAYELIHARYVQDLPPDHVRVPAD